EGRHLHEVSERCIFCGSPFTEARRNLIHQHFSRAVEDAQSILRSAIAQLKTVIIEVVCVSRWLDSRRWKDLGHEFIIEAEVQCPVQGRGGAVGAAVTEADRRGCR